MTESGDLTDPGNLAELLVATGHHHHRAYEESDGADPEWALWYAGYLQAKIWDSFGQVPTRSLLVHLLLGAEQAQAASADADEPWPAFYARFLAEGLG